MCFIDPDADQRTNRKISIEFSDFEITTSHVIVFLPRDFYEDTVDAFEVKVLFDEPNVEVESIIFDEPFHCTTGNVLRKVIIGFFLIFVVFFDSGHTFSV